MKHHRPPRFAPTHAHDCDSCRGQARIRLVAPIGFVPHGSVHPVKQFKNQFERAGFQFEAPTISQNICCIFWQNSSPLCGSFVPQTLSKGLFSEPQARQNIQDRPWKPSLYTGWEQHNVQGPSRSMLPPLLGTQAMPKATAISTCEHKAPAHERLGFYVATCCAMELAIAPFSHGRLHSTPRSSNQPVGIYSYCRCTWDDE